MYLEKLKSFTSLNLDQTALYRRMSQAIKRIEAGYSIAIEEQFPLEVEALNRLPLVTVRDVESWQSGWMKITERANKE